MHLLERFHIHIQIHQEIFAQLEIDQKDSKSKDGKFYQLHSPVRVRIITFS